LIANFFFLVYDSFARFPPSLRVSWAPQSMETDLRLTGLALSIIGYGIALWSVISLGKSFALMVSVREVVLRGPYRFVRHPFYLGQALVILGLAVTYAAPGMLILNAIHLSLFLVCGLMEERTLAAHSESYREYMKTTGFFLPKSANPSGR
jgi:protein-S-isoprenylcysteine O-methyltransferase Ste14